MENTEQAQNPEVAAQAEIHHEKKSPQESFAELRKAKEDLERQVWQAQQEKSWMEKQLQQQQQLQQQARHRRKARSYLDHGVLRLRIDRQDNVVQNTIVGQKILTEAFTWNMFH